jgi:hypothetical protein
VDRILLNELVLDLGKAYRLTGRATLSVDDERWVRAQGRFSVGPALLLWRGALDVVARQGMASGEVRNLLRGASFTWRGEGEQRSGQFSGTLTAVLPPHELKDDSELPGLLGLGRSLRIGGRIGAQASARLEDGRLHEQTTVSFTDLRIASALWDASLEGLSGRMDFSNLYPPRMSSPATLTLKKARVGDLVLGPGSTRFQLVGTDFIDVEAVEVGLLGGTMSTQPFRIDTRNFSTTCSVTLTELELSQVLKEAFGARVVGQGLLDGLLTLRIERWPYIDLEDQGYLRVRGSERWLKVQDTEMVEQVLAGVGSSPQEAVTEALKDFVYDDLRMDVITRDGTRIARFHTKGRGRQGVRPQEIGGLTIEVHDVGRMISVPLLMKSGLERVLPKGRRPDQP